jgi:hypothetical protein
MLGACLGKRPILSYELVGGFLEKLAGLEFAIPVFSAEAEIPVLRDFLRAGEAVFLGGNSPVLPGEISRALPRGAVLTLVNVKLAPHQLVMLCHKNYRPIPRNICNLCKTCVREKIAEVNYKALFPL